MFKLIEGKVQFIPVKSGIVVQKYFCNCKHMFDIINNGTYEFLEYHVHRNHMINGDLTCPKCMNTIFNVVDKIGKETTCIECEVNQFIGSTYINVWWNQN